ncbi:hypothetical protein [Gleimia europaea]|uniref:Uncharacterized protein n=1 Tax=Gleimia europaea ACS-120-V-Col10b TaxID=883069 RepID=A0A9W5VWQ6_9ACTO|nr:hypothetical protein [Gleimia europaea]EPD31267.1 hypothetical protein HMPREF9238_01035 [Gleimia europaea ACS-120-V-Col10b]
MDAIFEAEAGLQALDLAISYAAGVRMDWDGEAARAANAQLSAHIGQLVELRHRLFDARQAAIAARMDYYAQMSAACLGVL